MKRFLPLLLIVLFIGALFSYEVYFEKTKVVVQPVTPTVGSLTIYTDIPNEISNTLASAYEDTYHVKIHILSLTEKQMADKLAHETPLKGDLLITNRENLIEGAKHKQFVPTISENTDLVNIRFKGKKSYWVGLWYDPVVFVQSAQFYQDQGKKIDSWRALRNYGSFSIVMPDFVTSEKAANTLYSFVEMRGEINGLAYFISIKDHVTQYTKFLNTPIRLAALGEADIGIGYYSDSESYEKKKYPIRVIFPKDGTPYYLQGAAILKGTKKKKEAQAFINWLLSKEGYNVMVDNDFNYLSTNPEILKKKDALGKELILFKTKGHYTEKGKEKLLKRWVDTARF